MNKYPVYIVSKGRWQNPITARMFDEDGVNYKIVVEPQEYELYSRSIAYEKIIVLPFSNLGLGSYPARNFIWQHAIEQGASRHWIFDDNIYRARRYVKGRRIPISSLLALKILEDFTDRYENIGISAFNYHYFVTPGTSDKKPFYLNTHAYSCMLIKNDMPFRWRLKYNEDVDLCLQVLNNGLCTVLFNALMMQKVSTVAKLKGGNQDELYQGNSRSKKMLKARSLEEVWPQYVKTITRFNRPHHYIDWKKYFTHPLIRRTDLDWSQIEQSGYDMQLSIKKEIKAKSLQDFVKREKGETNP